MTYSLAIFLHLKNFKCCFNKKNSNSLLALPALLPANSRFGTKPFFNRGQHLPLTIKCCHQYFQDAADSFIFLSLGLVLVSALLLTLAPVMMNPQLQSADSHSEQLQKSDQVKVRKSESVIGGDSTICKLTLGTIGLHSEQENVKE